MVASRQLAVSGSAMHVYLVLGRQSQEVANRDGVHKAKEVATIALRIGDVDKAVRVLAKTKQRSLNTKGSPTNGIDLAAS